MRIRKMLHSAVAVASAVSLTCVGPSWAYDPQVAASTAKGEWTTWGGDSGFQRYSPLDQINAKNVKQLEIVWRATLLPQNRGRPDSNNIASPLMVNGMLYLVHGFMQVSAIDPGTGETRWTYTPPQYDTGRAGFDSRSKGLAYWTDGTTARLFNNTPDGRLISIDPATGKADPKFGYQGQIFLKRDLGRSAPYVGSTSPPTVVGNIVVAQIVGDLTAPEKEATPGFIRGYDVRTGKLVWTFHTIPQAGEYGNETWGDGSWSYTGNTDVWTMMSADQDLGYLYVPVGAATNDFYGGHRPGNNLFSESIVCIDAKTGKRVWHFQVAHHGLWDYDPPAAPILHDIVLKGKTIKAVTLLTKQGIHFVFDRVTGQPVWPIEERPVPQIPVPGDKQSPTQPFPAKPAPLFPTGYSDDMLIDFTPEIKKQALEIASKYERGPLYTPPIVPGNGKIGTWVNPSMQGGPNWVGGAYDPDTNRLFVPARILPYGASLALADPMRTGQAFTRPVSVVIQGPNGLPINRPPWSTITATDMGSGDHVWQKPIGGAPDNVRNNPALKGLKLDFDNMGKWNIRPGLFATKTLLFMGEAGGYGDPGGPMFRAYDKATGKVVSELELPTLMSAAPITYMFKGRQYIAVVVSSNKHPAELVAMALPEKGAKPRTSLVAALPAPAAPPAEQLARPVAARGNASGGDAPGGDAPGVSASGNAGGADRIAVEGRRLYAASCAVCHGPNGEGQAGANPAVANIADFESILGKVRSGGFAMPAMSASMSEQDMVTVSRFIANGGLKTQNAPKPQQ